MSVFNCGKILLVFLIGQCLVLNEAGRPRKKSQPKDKGEAMYECLKKQACDCGKNAELQTCFSKMMDVTMRYFVDDVQRCFNLTEPVPLTEAANIACTLPEEKWVVCRNPILDNFNDYLNKMYASMMPEKKQEALKVEDAKRCFGPTMSLCAAYPGRCM